MLVCVRESLRASVQAYLCLCVCFRSCVYLRVRASVCERLCRLEPECVGDCVRVFVILCFRVCMSESVRVYVCA